MLKAAIKHGGSEDQVRHRIVPAEAVSKWADKLEELKDEISGIIHDEKEEKQVTNYQSVNVLRLNPSSASTGRNGAQEGTKYH